MKVPAPFSTSWRRARREKVKATLSTLPLQLLTLAPCRLQMPSPVLNSLPKVLRLPGFGRKEEKRGEKRNGGKEGY